MTTRNITLSDVEHLEEAAADAAAGVFIMDEDAFRAFYERTARALWAYLSRVTGDPSLADDLLQDTYYRFLRSGAVLDGEAHRRNYLFRIATNLVRDGRRRRRTTGYAAGEGAADADQAAAAARDDGGERAAVRNDVRRAMGRLKPRDRQMLWLAYAEGSSHEEIAAALGLRARSVRVLLFRARRRLADLLRGSGANTAMSPESCPPALQEDPRDLRRRASGPSRAEPRGGGRREPGGSTGCENR